MQLLQLPPVALPFYKLILKDTKRVPSLIREWLEAGQALPPVIHYEPKLMHKWMRKGKNNALAIIHTLLWQHGYTIIQG
jgi:hypothetical protein